MTDLYSSVNEHFYNWLKERDYTFTAERPTEGVLPEYLSDVKKDLNRMALASVTREAIFKTINALATRIEGTHIDIRAPTFEYPLLVVNESTILKVNGMIMYCIPGSYEKTMITQYENVLLESVEFPTKEEVNAFMKVSDQAYSIFRNFLEDVELLERAEVPEVEDPFDDYDEDFDDDDEDDFF